MMKKNEISSSYPEKPFAAEICHTIVFKCGGVCSPVGEPEHKTQCKRWEFPPWICCSLRVASCLESSCGVCKFIQTGELISTLSIAHLGGLHVARTSERKGIAVTCKYYCLNLCNILQSFKSNLNRTWLFFPVFVRESLSFLLSGPQGV